ncbi:hypothetical protein XELAEV_18010922mg [Xenopus laevis]|uniref:Uncharacterized protein n=1 Tax=Xenopus laevis TaxID=8355 RepID=A0A974I2E4_XENLA|nr:hypothetical protein XELAEV_18010922mg [Xenopus laevis]
MVIKEAFERAVASDRSLLLQDKGVVVEPHGERETPHILDGNSMAQGARVNRVDTNPKRRRKTQLSNTRFCTMFSKQAHKIKRIVQKHWKILLQDPHLARNVASWISKSLYRSKDGSQGAAWLKYKGTCRCGRNRCKALLTNTNKKYKIPCYFNCLSKGVVYLATCYCGAQNVGQTVRPVGVRILEHLSAAERGDTKSAIANHVVTGQCDLNKIRFQIIDRPQSEVRRGDVNRRLYFY